MRHQGGQPEQGEEPVRADHPDGEVEPPDGEVVPPPPPTVDPETMENAEEADKRLDRRTATS